MLRETLLTLCSGASLPRSGSSQSGRKPLARLHRRNLRIPCPNRQNPFFADTVHLSHTPILPSMDLYTLLRRLPRACYIVTALTLYLLLLWMGGQETTVTHLPGRTDFSKIYHVVFYGGWCALVWLSMRHPSILVAVGLTMLAGAGDEFHQSFLPFREASLSDVLLDTVAATACALMMSAFERRAAAR